MLKNKIKKMKITVVILSVLSFLLCIIMYFAHYHISAYCINQKKITDSISQSDSINVIDSIK